MEIFFAVKDPSGMILAYHINYTQEAAQAGIEKSFKLNWEILNQQGYSIVPVQIQEIDKR